MKHLLSILLSFVIHTAWSQHVVQGTVTEAESMEIVAGATVYMNNSTVRTSTDKDGKYRLSLPSSGNYELVISAIGHELAVLEISVSGEIIKNVKLHRKNVEIEEITISAYLKDGWKQWGAYFTETFIGTSAFSKQTKILNPEVLQFRYNASEKILQVSANKPLKISNRALGYEIAYDLQHYSMNFNSRYLLFEGFASFQDQKRISSKIRRNRKQAYQSSFMRFIRSTYSNSWQEDGYEVRELVRIVQQERIRVDSLMKTINARVYRDLQGDWNAYFASQNEFNTDSIQNFRKILEQPKAYDIVKGIVNESQIMTKNHASGMKEVQYDHYLHIQHPEVKREDAYFSWKGKTDGSSILRIMPKSSVWIDARGNFSPAANWLQEGYWAWYSKLCTMLPLDYVSDNPN